MHQTLMSIAFPSEPIGESVPSRALRASVRRSPLAVAGVVLAAYALWIGAILSSGHDAREWIGFGYEFAGRPNAQAIMHVDPHGRFVRAGFGIDGQFYYYIAVDPARAPAFLDDPSYRFKRILYPMLARTLALGRPDIIPYTMILINWLAVAGGTLAIAAWLRRRGLNPWLAMIYGLYPGLFLAFQRDYTEPLSYALMAAAVYAFSFGGKRQLLVSPALFALAALTRDKVIAFACFYAAGLLLAGFREWTLRDWPQRLLRNIPRAATYGAIAALPSLAYDAFLERWLHSMPAVTGQLGGPLTGAAAFSLTNPNLYLALLCVVMPGAVLTWMGIRALARGEWKLEVFALLVTIQLSITVANIAYWNDVPGGLMRLSIAWLMLGLYCIPIFDRITGGRRWWLWTSSAGWLALLAAFAVFAPVTLLQTHL